MLGDADHLLHITGLLFYEEEVAKEGEDKGEKE